VRVKAKRTLRYLVGGVLHQIAKDEEGDVPDNVVANNPGFFDVVDVVTTQPKQVRTTEGAETTKTRAARGGRRKKGSK